MDPADYQRWLAGGTEGSLASQGERLFQKYACNTCHTGDATGRGPNLTGVYGNDVMLSDNAIVKADDNYIRESILNPRAKIVKGYSAIMPVFQGQVSEDDLLKLIAYVRSLGDTKKQINPPESPQSFQANSGAPAPPPPAATSTQPKGNQP